PILKARAEGDGYRLSIACDKAYFDKIARPPGPLADEMPSFSDVVECLTSSGMIGFANQGEAIARINQLRGLKRKAFFCIDTNLLYRRFISNWRVVDPRDTILVDTVQNEVESQLNYKYTPDQVFALKSAAQFEKALMEEFVNKRMKTSRKAAYFAMSELKHIRNGGALMADAPGQSGSDKEANDLLIARALRHAEKERGIYPVMLTADSMMTTICEAESIEFVYLKMPFEVGTFAGTPRQMRALIFSLAVVFGAIKVNSVVIFSEYRGKDALEKARLHFLNTGIKDEFVKGVGICRSLLSLGIER
ncbi:MAG TPA: hypothetical protein P5290_07165, partial [Candidatus Methanomethylicus sp.]|nr:hypothetical protein [Candidatus Methanomethylicus sp.]